ncbi:MAG: hypothetical protein GWO81_06725 [Verrucomicrobia bacterium]|nr:hypothetical protein [Verrucomicrobiota bacterium]
MKKIRLILIFSMGIKATAFAVFAQNATITFDLSLLQSNVASDTITASDGSTTLTVSARNDDDSARNISVIGGLETFFSAGTAKSVIFNFNTDVVLESYRVSSHSISFEGDERYILNLSGTNFNEPFPVDNSAFLGQTLNFNNKLTISAGTNLEIITHNPDDGAESINWNRLTVTTVSEPATYALILAGLALAYTALQRRRAS